jgi:hypothetical protein
VNGYLQRLVSTAMGTGSSVHPLVKPVFSSPASPDELALRPEGDNLKPVFPRSASVEPTLSRQDNKWNFVSTSRRADGVPAKLTTDFADTSTTATAPGHSSRRAQGEQPEFGEPQKDPKAPLSTGAVTVPKFQPLLPESTTTVTVTNLQPQLTSNGPPPTLQSATRSAEPALPATQPSSKRRQRKQSQSPTANIPVYVPLLNRSPSHLRSDLTEAATPAYSGAKMSRQNALQWSAPAAKNGSDEIQIHIGRIEVTAVPPPAATPRPKRVAKGPSLQEYLKRRDRRL